MKQLKGFETNGDIPSRAAGGGVESREGEREMRMYTVRNEAKPEKM